MSAISEFSAKVTTFFEKQSTALTGISESVTDLAGDIEGLKKLIEELQNSPGAITPEDQALLDQAEAKIGDLSTRSEAAAGALATLAAQTPPKA